MTKQLQSRWLATCWQRESFVSDDIDTDTEDEGGTDKGEIGKGLIRHQRFNQAGQKSHRALKKKNGYC